MLGPDENKMQGNIDWLETYGLDLEDRVSCDTINCERPAAHYTHVKCCNAVVIGCAECLKDSFKVVMWMISQHKMVVCKSCGKSNHPQGWLSRPQKLSLLDS